MMNADSLTWKRRAVRAPLLFAIAAVLLAHQGTGAQSYSSGQNISPAYEGWEQNPDGSFDFVFGYMNRNWEEEIDVPVGPDNGFEPGDVDRGQPTHFLPRRNRFVFKVRVPADWGQKELIWTLKTQGRVEKAYATLRTDYLIDDVVIASETGALGAGTSSPEVRSNKPPVIKLEGDTKRTVKVGQPLALAAIVTDDGIPKRRQQGVLPQGTLPSQGQPGQPQGAPGSQGAAGAPAAPGAGTAPAAGAGAAPGGGNPFGLFGGRGRNPAYFPPNRITVGKSTGLHFTWFVYRGSSEGVTFSPEQTKPWEDTRAGANSPWSPLWQPPAAPADNRWTSTVTFDQPGTYVLRGRADDGALLDDREVTITVTK
jgi:hypothetical protein